jgi:muramoyltetrapeptide carboxypeptidase LdcA involved in peptidoglycan recycling
MQLQQLTKLTKGEKVAIVSPSFAAPGQWPKVYELGLKRLGDVFGLEPVEFPATKKLGASGEERAADLVEAFEDPAIKAVIATLGGNDQVTYIQNLPDEPFTEHPKPFFGFSDNTHFSNFLFLHGVPSYYGGCLFTQFAMQGSMEAYTVEYLRHALFDVGEYELSPAGACNDVDVDWGIDELLDTPRVYEPSDGYYWDGALDVSGHLWGGCLESVDELLRHGAQIPSLKHFEEVVLMLETSEEVPDANYVFRVLRALGERGILSRVQGVLIGRPKSWNFDKQTDEETREQYREEQRGAVLSTIRTYHQDAPVVQNVNFGHTHPQICMPYGNMVRIQSSARKLFATF